jgi:hypothetical protein
MRPCLKKKKGRKEKRPSAFLSAGFVYLKPLYTFELSSSVKWEYLPYRDVGGTKVNKCIRYLHISKLDLS